MHAPLSPPELRDLTLSDGYVAKARYWSARGDATAPVAFLYLHGIQSHGGWYEWSASVLADSGAAVLMPDRRGSGLNQAARGDVLRAERWLDDLDEQRTWLQTHSGARAVAVVGVSWGGKLAVAWEALRHPGVAAILLIAPGIFPQVDLHWFQKLGVGMALLRTPDERFPVPLNDAALFTHEAEWISFIENDPLLLTHVTARFLLESRKLDRKVQKIGENALKPPTTLLLAGAERIIRNDVTRDWLDRVNGNRGAVRTFEKDAHTLEFTTDVRPLEREIRAWSEKSARLAAHRG